MRKERYRRSVLVEEPDKKFKVIKNESFPVEDSFRFINIKTSNKNDFLDDLINSYNIFKKRTSISQSMLSINSFW